jgi:hypothetical protein
MSNFGDKEVESLGDAAMTFDERLKQAKDTSIGDRWRKRKHPERWAEVLWTDGIGHLRMRHWNGRVTRKWYSYLACDYEKVTS